MDQKLRIGFVCVQDARKVGEWSGIPAQVLKSLSDLDVEVEIFSPLSQRFKYLLAPLKILARLKGKSVSLTHYRLALQSFAGQISRLIREKPVDVIFATSSIPVTYLKCTQPIVIWTDAVFHGMHDYYDGAFAAMPADAVRRAKLQEETSLKNCAFAAYSSEWAAGYARKFTDPGKIKVIPFGASFEIHHSQSDIEHWATLRREQRPRSCELLFIGVNWERKGGPIAVETAKILNESGIPTRLTVVGCQPQETLPEFVRTLGFISKATEEGRSQMQTLLRDSDFFILPTMAEAAGIVFCEASAFGLPSLSYATGGVSEYVRDGVNGVCLPVGTPATGFAESIREILSDSEHYKTLCLNSFHEYENRLNWGSSGRALLSLCRLAVDEASGAH